jgi:hypothetical protein
MPAMSDKFTNSLKRFAQAFGADVNELLAQTVPDYTNTDLALIKPTRSGGKRRRADVVALEASRLTPKK